MKRQVITFSKSEPGRYRSRVDDFPNPAEPPGELLYARGEVVYIAFPGKSQPEGPYVITATDWEGLTYRVKDQATGQQYPHPVGEKYIRILQ
ncbi:hypothetical protein FALBO_1537 [Fusarium albosuccineum]|uniref:Uncharacterized protein n=1 Tax=Fusarium albosuccineum TaxID=1237068 RepID=A0A8H4LNQ1_9HYPO|nr:hypothetical protein FALBO_1537 [Fusarium albosuccineum]